MATSSDENGANGSRPKPAKASAAVKRAAKPAKATKPNKDAAETATTALALAKVAQADTKPAKIRAKAAKPAKSAAKTAIKPVAKGKRRTAAAADDDAAGDDAVIETKPRARGTGTLVIVESPAKAKTIKKYLGAGYVVKASVGHVKDLPKKTMGIDIENDFAPEYEVIEGKKKVLAEIKSRRQEGRAGAAGARPRSRGGGHRLAHRRGDAPVEPEHPARAVQRDHQEGDQRGDRAARWSST